MITMQTPGLLEVITAKTETPRPDCMIWVGATDRGYGRVTVDGRAKRTHRVVWELTFGPIPEGMTVDHLCRIRACVNVDQHMELVTAGENSRRAATPHRADLMSLTRALGADAAERVGPTVCPKDGTEFDRPPGPKRCPVCRARANKRAVDLARERRARRRAATQDVTPDQRFGEAAAAE